LRFLLDGKHLDIEGEDSPPCLNAFTISTEQAEQIGNSKIAEFQFGSVEAVLDGKTLAVIKNLASLNKPPAADSRH
jgi:hypothetical protein